MEIRVKLKIKDVEIELSQLEIKELQVALNKLMGMEDHKTLYVPYTYPWYPATTWEITSTGVVGETSTYCVALN